MNNDINDNIISFIIETPDTIMSSLASRIRERRLEKNLTQKELASRAGISFGTYRRFETTGEIALKGLIMIALALETASEFSMLFSTPTYSSISELLNLEKSKQRKRGGKK